MRPHTACNRRRFHHQDSQGQTALAMATATRTQGTHCVPFHRGGKHQPMVH